MASENLKAVSSFVEGAPPGEVRRLYNHLKQKANAV